MNQFSAAIRYVHVSPERETDTSCHLSVKCQVTIFLDSYYCVELVNQFFGFFVNFVDVVSRDYCHCYIFLLLNVRSSQFVVGGHT